MRKFIGLVLVCGLGGGCDGLGWGPKPQPTPTPTPKASADPAAPAAQRAVLATVNGRPLYVSQLHGLLVDAYGEEMAGQLVATEQVRQELVRQKMTITDAEVQAEHERTMARELKGLDPSQHEKVLSRLLQQKGIARQQWDLIIRRNAMLRKLAGPQVKITDAELEAEFAEQLGRKVVVRHIQTESHGQAQRLLDKLRREGADFAELARKYSRNQTAKDGGLLPPIGPNSPRSIPAAMRQVAWAMQKVGQISDPVQVETAFHILKLDKIIPPQPGKLEAVRAAVTAALRERQGLAIQVGIMRRLTARDKIRYVHPKLRTRAQEATK